jgi:hypothetical protein
MKKMIKYIKPHTFVVLTIIFQLFFGIFSKAQCDDKLVDKAVVKSGNDALFIREFKIKQSENEKKKKQKMTSSIAKYDVRLNQGFVYRFNIENDQNSEAKALLQLWRENLVLASTYDVDKQIDNQSFDYFCNKSGEYQVLISFIKGNSGCAVGIMSAVIQDSTTVASFADSTGVENVLYTGIENYVDIAASNIRNGKLEVSISRGKITPEGGLYLILVNEPGPLTVNVIARDSQNNITETFNSEFTVKEPMLPTVSLMGSSGGLIKKDEIVNSFPELILNTGHTELKFKIKSFAIANNMSGGIAVAGSNRLNMRQIALIRELKNGETFYIKDIEIVDSKGRVYQLSPLGFIISD